ncbi:hypothetical protein [Parabacteroides chinchillae]|uniref:Uncharacterized protein n=1 Tax=Parabacteroides chinchillae TaxID=871327 RepID=A0A8G2BWD0_9BACT|nr:hypothetical protein [Parabacteroides chinchillae]SEF85975.1 hypothetical protein SAMN05444001_108100 [Parabacteroides chinchillae]
MQTILQRQTVKQELMILFAVATIAFAGYRQAAAPHYMSKSKIEEGTVVQRNDSVTTVIIPDIR